jgi:undecaprenyl-phosphate 4-deoxy-4-formamido-L-arabinose transferase
MKTVPLISIVIPVHNEEAVLETLYTRLTAVMDGMGKSYEILFTNDGSRDKSAEMLDELHRRRPNEIRVIHFNGNFGQHMAIMAGFERVRGSYIVTLDADLQNPPEEIPKIIDLMEQGHDVVGGYRMDRQDSAWRLFFSRAHNWLRTKIAPQLNMKDEGCMLRGYSRRVVDLMASTGEASTFIPALALSYATNPAEIGVKHAPRELGETSYNFYKLIRYNFDLVTGFSLVPLQLFTFIGISVSLLSTVFVIYLAIRRLTVGPEADGLFTLFAILFFLAGIILMGLGIVGEYIGRIYQEVRQRPRFVIREVIEQPCEEKDLS